MHHATGSQSRSTSLGVQLCNGSAPIAQCTTGHSCALTSSAKWHMQELGPKHFWISEAVFALLFGSFILWLVSPFFTERKTFYTVVVLRRLLIHLVCALLRPALCPWQRGCRRSPAAASLHERNAYDTHEIVCRGRTGSDALPTLKL